MKKISFVITAYNEAENLKELHEQIGKSIKSFSNYEFEYIFVENGSTDNSLEVLRDIKNKNKNIKIIKLSRNFGFDGGITAGIDHTSSDAVIIMTANLQDDPRVIPQFIEYWESGYDMVYGIVKSRPGKSILRKINSSIFYLIINKLSKNLIPKNVSDYRLVDKKVIDAVRSLKEYHRFYRGFFSWVGFKSIGVEFKRQKRFAGKSKALTFKVISSAFKAIFSFTSIPLKFASYFAFILSFLAILVLSIQIYNWFKYGVPFDGFGTIIGVILLVASMMLFSLGIIGEYLSLIFDESKKRPIYIVEKEI